MLYERWRQTAAEHRGELALLDAATGQRWTFAELDAAAEKTLADHAPAVFPQGNTPDFILTTLRGWREGLVTCPLEAGQLPPTFDPLPQGCVHLKLTSATTRAPRMVAFTAGQLIADAENIVATMGLRPDWPNVGAISLAHSYGFSNVVLPLLLCGVPIVLADSPLPEALRRAAALLPAITLPAVPALWRAWLDASAIPGNVRLAISAGAPLPLALEQSAHEIGGIKIHNFYGASECGGIAYDRSTEPRTDAACVGAALENVQLTVGADGCLEVRSAAVGETYWPEPAAALAARCYRTSDLAEIESGRVYLRGRASDLIIVAGRKVSPETVELALLAHADVRDCLVFGVPATDAERGETVVACVVADGSVTADRLRQFLLAGLPAWQVPREWRFVESLEVNDRGKRSRAEWRRRFLDGSIE